MVVTQLRWEVPWNPKACDVKGALQLWQFLVASLVPTGCLCGPILLWVGWGPEVEPWRGHQASSMYPSEAVQASRVRGAAHEQWADLDTRGVAKGHCPGAGEVGW